MSKWLILLLVSGAFFFAQGLKKDSFIDIKDDERKELDKISDCLGKCFNNNGLFKLNDGSECISTCRPGDECSEVLIELFTRNLNNLSSANMQVIENMSEKDFCKTLSQGFTPALLSFQASGTTCINQIKNKQISNSDLESCLDRITIRQFSDAQKLEREGYFKTLKSRYPGFKGVKIRFYAPDIVSFEPVSSKVVLSSMIYHLLPDKLFSTRAKIIREAEKL